MTIPTVIIADVVSTVIVQENLVPQTIEVLAGGPMGPAAMGYAETPIGLVNSVNNIFTLVNIPYSTAAVKNTT